MCTVRLEQQLRPDNGSRASAHRGRTEGREKEKEGFPISDIYAEKMRPKQVCPAAHPHTGGMEQGKREKSKMMCPLNSNFRYMLRKLEPSNSVHVKKIILFVESVTQQIQQI